MLIVESLISVGFTDDRKCTVASGRWIGLFTGISVEVAGDLDVDHMVPLANAHESGGWAWSAQQKEDYANDLSFDHHLIAVTASVNRSKGARGPEDWKPPDTSYWCEYAINWITVKSTWGLTAITAEWTALESMLETCSFDVSIAPEGVQPTPTATATGSLSVIDSVSSGMVFVTEFMPNPAAVSDTAGEWFEIHNSDPNVSVDIDGWVIKDSGSNAHVLNNGGPLLVPPLGFLVLGRNADTATNGGVPVHYQYSGFTLGNTDDEIIIIGLAGESIDTVVYRTSQVFTGAAANLSPSTFDAVSNDQPGNWCPATAAISGGDKGTPGSPNDSCS